MRSAPWRVPRPAGLAGVMRGLYRTVGSASIVELPDRASFVCRRQTIVLKRVFQRRGGHVAVGCDSPPLASQDERPVRLARDRKSSRGRTFISPPRWSQKFQLAGSPSGRRVKDGQVVHSPMLARPDHEDVCAAVVVVCLHCAGWLVSRHITTRESVQDLDSAPVPFNVA